jgi:hypothetical protein
MQQSSGGHGCVFSADGYMTKLPVFPMRGSRLAPVGKTFHRTGHAQNAARVKKILTWLKSKMATLTERYGHPFLSCFGARPNSARLLVTSATGGEPRANLDEAVYWNDLVPTDSFFFFYPAEVSKYAKRDITRTC